MQKNTKIPKSDHNKNKKANKKQNKIKVFAEED